MGIYSSFIPNCQILEAHAVSFRWGKNAQTVAQPDDRMLFSAKKMNYQLDKRHGETLSACY